MCSIRLYMRVFSGVLSVKSYCHRNDLHGGLLKMGANWVPIGYQLALNWHRFTTNWVNRRRGHIKIEIQLLFNMCFNK